MENYQQIKTFFFTQMQWRKRDFSQAAYSSNNSQQEDRRGETQVKKGFKSLTAALKLNCFKCMVITEGVS